MSMPNIWKPLPPTDDDEPASLDLDKKIRKSSLAKHTMKFTEEAKMSLLAFRHALRVARRGQFVSYSEAIVRAVSIAMAKGDYR